jgi:hypothetical protein
VDAFRWPPSRVARNCASVAVKVDERDIKLENNCEIETDVNCVRVNKVTVNQNDFQQLRFIIRLMEKCIHLHFYNYNSSYK